MSEKIVQHNKETIETCQEKSNGIFKGMPHAKGAQQTKPLCISKKMKLHPINVVWQD